MNGSRHIRKHVAHAIWVGKEMNVSDRSVQRLTTDQMSRSGADAALATFDHMRHHKWARAAFSLPSRAGRRLWLLRVAHCGEFSHACQRPLAAIARSHNYLVLVG
jgi:hypothetical protein